MTDRQLVRFLADADRGNDAALRDWLAATPKQEANDALYNIGNRATSTKGLIWFAPLILAMLFWATWRKFSQTGEWSDWLHPLIMMVVLSFPCWRVREGHSAVFYLAERGDKRAIPLLAATWDATTLSFKTRHARTEELLTHLLDKEAQQPSGYIGVIELRRIISTLVLPPSPSPHRDLRSDISTSSAYLVVAILRYLDHAGDWRDKDLLRTLAEQPAPDPVRLRNRALIHDVAVALLTPPVSKTIAAIAEAIEVTTPTVSTPAAPLVQTTRRRC